MFLMNNESWKKNEFGPKNNNLKNQIWPKE